MTNPVNPPPQVRIPEALRQDAETFGYFRQLNQILFQLWIRTGGSDDAISTVELGELYEPGIQTSSADELIEGIEADLALPDLSIDLLERVRALEIDLETWANTEEEEVEPTDFYLEVAKGNIPGHTAVHKFGINVDIADGVEEIVWSGSGVYTFSTTNDITDIVSDSASDTGTVEVRGLDSNWDIVVQTKQLNGITSVALDTPLIRVYRMFYQNATTNVGNIQCGVGSTTTSFAAGNLRAVIDIGAGQTLMAIFTIPNNKTGYVREHYGSIIGDPGAPAKEPTYGIFRIYRADRLNGYAPSVAHVMGQVTNGTSIIEHEVKPPMVFTERTDIYITMQPEGDIGSFSAGFDLVMVDD